ncbi:hypothetical protein K438DRAFT_1941143 [Mycena galopus ATCC 62051]|nr:hypothetical protein K438DRAFT_1941143 [Mycena galopus ATCC 62051]
MASFKLTIMPENVQAQKGEARWDFINNLRTILLETSRGEAIIMGMIPFVDELDSGSPRSPPLYAQMVDYLLNNFPNFVQTELPPKCFARTECTAGWMGRSVEDKKKDRLMVQLSTGVFGAWVQNADFPDSHPEVLGAVLTITILHELVHVLRRVFSATLTPEKLRGSHPSSMMSIIGPDGRQTTVCRGEGEWAWEESMLGEMCITFEGTGGYWTKILALGFSKNSKVQWVHMNLPTRKLQPPNFRASVMCGGTLNWPSPMGSLEPRVQRSLLPLHVVLVNYSPFLTNESQLRRPPRCWKR